jgi:hypothetical protein
MPHIANGLQGIQDFSALSELVQPEHNLLEKLNIFDVDYVNVDTVSLERIEDGVDTIVAKQRGGERNYAGRENARREVLEIPFFPLDVTIKASEILDFRKFLEGDQSESLLNRVQRAVKRIRKSHDRLKRAAMYACLDGASYTGVANSKLNKDYATLWGVTGSVATANVDFTALNVNPAAAMETARAHIQTQAKDEAAGYEIVVLCGSQWFNAYYDHPLVADDLSTDNDKEVERMGGNLVERSFRHKGVTFYLDASGMIATGEARVIPMGIADMMKVTYGPSDTLKGSEEEIKDIYTFAIEDPRKLIVETETSLICTNTRPELVLSSSGTF